MRYLTVFSTIPGTRIMDWRELKDEKTSDLIEYIKYKGQPGYAELAEAAFVTFTFRFSPEIVDKCRKIGKKRSYDPETCDLLAERSFERFWKYPFGFDKTKCTTPDFEKCVLFYLLKIVRNCFFDYDKELIGDHESPYDGSEEIIVEFPDIEQLDIPEDVANNLKEVYNVIEKTLSGLSAKHKTIYLTYKAYEKDGFKLPRSLLKKLREELELSQNSIRVYKNEAFQKVDENLKLYGRK